MFMDDIQERPWVNGKEISHESLIPKGSRFKRYCPKGVLNVHSKLDANNPI